MFFFYKKQEVEIDINWRIKMRINPKIAEYKGKQGS